MMRSHESAYALVPGLAGGRGRDRARRVQVDSSSLPEGKYVRVYGSFKGASIENPNALGQIQVYNARLVRDHNEVRCRCPAPLPVVL